MTALQSTVAGPGHNSRDELEEMLLEQRHAELWRRRDALEGLIIYAMSAVVDSPEAAGKLGDQIKQLGTFVKLAEEARKGEKKPYLDGCRQIDAFFGDLTSPIEAGIKSLKEVQAAWMKANDVTSKLRGDYGSVSTLRTDEIVIGFRRAGIDWPRLSDFFDDKQVLDALKKALECGLKVKGAEYGDRDTITTR